MAIVKFTLTLRLDLFLCKMFAKNKIITLMGILVIISVLIKLKNTEPIYSDELTETEYKRESEVNFKSSLNLLYQLIKKEALKPKKSKQIQTEKDLINGYLSKLKKIYVISSRARYLFFLVFN